MKKKSIAVVENILTVTIIKYVRVQFILEIYVHRQN